MIVTPVLFLIAAYFLIAQYAQLTLNIFWSVLAGSVGGIIIGLITEFYTSGRPIQKIAEQGKTGPATVLITGLATGMQ